MTNGSRGKYPIGGAVTGRSYAGLSVEETFSKIYATSAWGKGSGAGSLPVHCLKWIEFVRKFIRERNIQSVIDLGCGDWQFSPYIYHDLKVEYVGYDVVLPVIQENTQNWGDQGYKFEHLEFSTKVADIKDAELYILKDVLQHWSSARIRTFLSALLSSKRNLRYDWPEDDIVDGGWRPLVASRSPLSDFSPNVLLRFPSLPNSKEVCVVEPPSKVSAPAFSQDKGSEASPAENDRGWHGFSCWQGFRRLAKYPKVRRSIAWCQSGEEHS
eukprot:TRINITY_DN2529_c3_g1_i2.p1 TRINITY_DN2529_c3_g1~~TRINITY_DN2529_c3_g1_i2.p1  ORF type:complete len:270 (-),score=33.66 TRINITY_DN2529_c3_g1_i2:126-935(-)